MPRSSFSVNQTAASSTRAVYPPLRGRREEREPPTISPTSPSSGSFDDVPNDVDEYEPDDEATQTPPSSHCSTIHDQYDTHMDDGSYSDVAVRRDTRTKAYHSKPVGSSRPHKLTLPPEPDSKLSRHQQRRPRQVDASSSRSGRSSPLSRGRHDHDRSYRTHGRRPHRSMSEKVMRDNTVPPSRSRSAPPPTRRGNKGFWRNVGLYVRIMMSKFFHWGQY